MGLAAIYVSANIFKVVGDRTDSFPVSRRVRAWCGIDGYKYGTVSDSSYDSGTGYTTVTLHDSVLTPNLESVDVSVLSTGDSGAMPRYLGKRHVDDSVFVAYDDHDRSLHEDIGISCTDVLYVNYSNSLATLIATVGSSQVSVVIDRATTVESNTTVPSNVHLIIRDEGSVTVSAGVTLTINGPFEAPAKRVFYGDGQVQFGSTDCVVYADWFGTTLATAVASVPSGGTVVLLRNTYTVDVASSVELSSNTRIVGSGYASYIYSSGTRSAPMILIEDVSNVTIERVRFSSGGDCAQTGMVEIRGDSSNIKIIDNVFESGYAGIWINPVSGGTIENVEIRGNVIDDCSRNIYVGCNQATTGDEIKQIRIVDNVSKNARSNGDGLKIIQSVYDCVVASNVFSGNDADGIDMFVSGDKVSIVGNIIEGNGVHGIDAKANTTDYPETTWGHGREFVITGNIIRSNGYDGVCLSKSNSGEWPYIINVSDNVITRNQHYGVWIEVNYVVLSGNVIAFNGQSSISNYSGVRLYGQFNADPLKGVVVEGNVVVNNGNAGTTNHGILVSSYVDGVSIIGNHIENTSMLDNANQNNGLTVSATEVNNVIVKSNRITGHSNYDVSIGDGADIIGEIVAVRVGDIAAGTTAEYPIYFSRSKAFIVSAHWINGGDITADSTNYVALTIRNRGSDGTDTNSAYNFNTSATSVSKFVKNDFTRLSASYAVLDEDYVVTLVKTNAGTGQALTDAVVFLNVIEH